MSTETLPADAVIEDLDAFSADFFGQKTDKTEPASTVEKEPEVSAVDDATNPEQTQTGDDEPAAEEKLNDEAPKPVKKDRFQERINELTAGKREAERQLQEALSKLESKTTPESKTDPAQGPQPTDTLEDGTDKYPLGEFDPLYIRDLTKHTLTAESYAMKQAEARENEQRQADAQKAELQTQWQTKLEPAKERYPDFEEKGEQLLSTFDGIDQAYGEYLASTIMSMDYGTDVLYHLANHPELAETIVKSGATRATIALGRLESMFIKDADEVEKTRPKVSAAPPPPPQNKGTSTARSVPADTDDLDAFETAFFQKRRKA